MQLTWDFARKLDDAATPGNTTSYYDEWCQSFYVDGGYIKTQPANLVDGHWELLNRDSEKTISSAGYGILDIEHQENGAVYGVAQHGADFVFLIYQYMMDISDILSSGSCSLQPDNPIKAGKASLFNFESERFEDSSYSLFVPGNKISVALRVGDLALYDLYTFFIENSPFSIPTKEFSFSGRNKIGFYFSAQYFDETTSFSGTFTEIFVAIFTAAGLAIRDYLIEGTNSTASFLFKPTDTFLSGITTALKMCDWYIDDRPDGTIIVGSDAFIKANAASVGIYSFTRGTDTFTHSIDRSMDGVYSRVCVQRKGSKEKRIYANVDYYDGWHLATHRTFYQDVPDTTTDAQMSTILSQLTEQLQYSGIVESFTSPIRPWLQVGDIALISDLGPRYAGIISEINHTIGKDGFFTDFTVTSGGVITDPEGENPASSFVGKMGGANRRRRLLDYLKEGSSGSSAGSSSVGAITYEAAVSGGYEGAEQQLNENLALVADGAVIPVGGDAGAVLMKTTADDYDTEWKNADIDKYDEVAAQFDENNVYQATAGATVWEDLRVPLNAAKAAGTKQPGWEAWINGLFLYWFDPSTEEEVWFAVQLPHAWAGSAVTPHVHWTPKVTADGDPVNQTVEWGLEYTWIDVGGDFAASSTIYGKASIPNDANIVANRHYMTNLPSINPSASQDGLSSMLVCRLFRNATDASDDTYENDAGLLEFDIHYEVDMLGSRSVSSK